MLMLNLTLEWINNGWGRAVCASFRVLTKKAKAFATVSPRLWFKWHFYDIAYCYNFLKGVLYEVLLTLCESGLSISCSGGVSVLGTTDVQQQCPHITDVLGSFLSAPLSDIFKVTHGNVQESDCIFGCPSSVSMLVLTHDATVLPSAKFWSCDHYTVPQTNFTERCIAHLHSL